MAEQNQEINFSDPKVKELEEIVTAIVIRKAATDAEEQKQKVKEK